nr:metallopeptidase TldD-related protein [Peptostreptococcus russellii]
MQVVGEKEKIYIYKPEKKEVISREFQSEKVESDKKIEKILGMYEVSKKMSDSIHQIEGKGVEISSRKYIANTYGLEKYEGNSYAYVYSYAILKKNDEMKSGIEFELKDNFMDCDFERIAKDAVKKAEREFGAESVESGKYKVILINDEVSSLLSALESAFSAKSVQKNMSPLKGLLNEKIAFDKLTMKDVKVLPGTNIIESFDDEGVDKKDLEIIKDGVLKSFVHNIETADKDGVETTASAARSYKSTSFPGISNLLIEAGDTDFESLLEKMGDGLLITSIQGLHSGLNPVSGEFSVPCNGFLVESGKVKRAVNQIIMSSNIKEFLNSIVEIGSDSKITLDGSYVPSIMLENINISGS